MAAIIRCVRARSSDLPPVGGRTRLGAALSHIPIDPGASRREDGGPQPPRASPIGSCLPVLIATDSGWKLLDVDGRSTVVRCDCFRDTLTERLTSDARIPRRYTHCDLDRFVTYGNESLDQALQQARSLVDRFPVVSKGLFLLGPPGVGKTHLAVAVLRLVIEQKGARGSVL